MLQIFVFILFYSETISGIQNLVSTRMIPRSMLIPCQVGKLLYTAAGSIQAGIRVVLAFNTALNKFENFLPKTGINYLQQFKKKNLIFSTVLRKWLA